MTITVAPTAAETMTVARFCETAFGWTAATKIVRLRNRVKI